jgi:hypothetical protein
MDNDDAPPNEEATLLIVRTIVDTITERLPLIRAACGNPDELDTTMLTAASMYLGMLISLQAGDDHDDYMRGVETSNRILRTLEPIIRQLPTLLMCRRN